MQKAAAQRKNTAALFQRVQPRGRTEFFLIALFNMLFGVFGVAAAPLMAHWIVAGFENDPKPSLQPEAFLMALVLWGGTFYELRCTPEHKLRSASLRIYRSFMHWVSVIFAGCMALGYAALIVKPKSGLASPLANPFIFGVLLAIAVLSYLAFKLPIMWGQAGEAASEEE